MSKMVCVCVWSRLIEGEKGNEISKTENSKLQNSADVIMKGLKQYLMYDGQTNFSMTDDR